MKLITIIFILAAAALQAQLKEFTVTEMPAPTQYPLIMRSHPEDGVVIVYSSVSGLQFDSNTLGIDEVKNEEDRYYVFLKPETQIITVKKRGYIEGKLPAMYLKAKEVRYFKVEESGAGLADIPVNIIVTPADARIFIDSVFMGLKPQQKLKAGIHKLMIEKEGYKRFEKSIDVQENNTLFTVELEKVVQVGVEIRTVPEGAEIVINDAVRGKTNRGLYVYPGVYRLQLLLPGYMEADTIITVRETQGQRFVVNLIKNSAQINLSVIPADATIIMDNVAISAGAINAAPGRHAFAITRTGYLPVRDTVTVARGEMVNKSYNLTKNSSTLILAITPADANLLIDKEEYTGRKQIELAPGKHVVEIVKRGYKSQTEDIEIVLGKSTTRNYTLNALTGSLQFSVYPLEAEIELIGSEGKIINWQGMKMLNNLPVGTYMVQCRLQGYRAQSRTLIIEQDKTTTEDITLSIEVGGQTVQKENISTINSGKWGYSFILPGLGQLLEGRQTGWLELAGGVGAAIYYASARQTHQENMDKFNTYKNTVYNINPTTETKARAEQLKTSAENSGRAQNTALGIFCSIYTINIIDAILFRRDPGDKQVTITPALYGVGSGNMHAAMQVRVGI